MDDHPRLTQRKGHEYADDVELDQPAGISIESPDQKSGKGGQYNDSVAEDQPISPARELSRKETVAAKA